MLTLSERFDDEGEGDEGEEDAVQFLEAGEDAAENLQPAEEAFDFIAFSIECLIVAPRVDTIGLGRSGPLRAQPIQIFPRRISLGAVKSLRTRRRGQISWSWRATAARSKKPLYVL